jgi:hypothetical protein
MPKKAAAASTPTAGAGALACGNAECRKVLAPPLLQCSKCKAEAYCCKECQVPRPPRAPPTRAALCTLAPRLCALTHPLPAHPPLPDRRVEGRAQARVRRAGAGRGGGAAAARRAL